MARSRAPRPIKPPISSKFNVQGQLRSVTDRNGNQMEYIYQGGHLVRIVDPVGLETMFTYVNGRVSQITDPAARTTTLEYDAKGDLPRITDPDASSRTFEYDTGITWSVRPIRTALTSRQSMGFTVESWAVFARTVRSYSSTRYRPVF